MPETFTWIRPDGTELALSGVDTRRILWGIMGRFMPPIRVVEERVPLQSGSKVRYIDHGARDLDLPFYIEGSTEAGLRAEVRSLLGAFDPMRGEGTLRITAPGGDQREILCYYTGGMEGNEARGPSGISYQKVILSFRAFTPYWQDASDIQEEFGLVAPSAFLSATFFPMTISPDAIISDPTDISNTGDVEAWPVWTIYGPGTAVELENLTTGETIVITNTILINETMVIDTRPGIKTVKEGATNIYSSMDPTSTLWALPRGTSSVQVTLTGATEDSRVRLAYRRRYLGA